MTLRAKVLLAQGPLLVALAALSAVAFVTIGKLGESSQTIVKDNYRSVLAAQRMLGAAKALDDDAIARAAGRPAAEADRAQAITAFEEEPHA